MLFTSGTEGMPKGVMLTHCQYSASERAYRARVEFNPQDVPDACATGHATDFYDGVKCALNRARSVLLDIFTPEACLTLLAQQRLYLYVRRDAVYLRSVLVPLSNSLPTSSLRFSSAAARLFLRCCSATASSAVSNSVEYLRFCEKFSTPRWLIWVI